jgi:molybdate transport system substrate-binding protein
MATRSLVAELAAGFQQTHGVAVQIESVGGVDAARRVQAGEVFDLVILAADAIDALIAQGRLLGDSRCIVADSAVAIAVPAGSPPPDVGSEALLREALLKARAIGYSTGPSGQALLRLFARWGLQAQLGDKLVQARPGTPVGSLIAGGQVDLGFQQWSELMHMEGIQLLGMPVGLEIVTRFAAAVGAGAARPDEARALLRHMASADSADLKQRHGMQAPNA